MAGTEPREEAAMGTHDRRFWVALTVWGGVFVTMFGYGIYALIAGELIWGLVLTPLGFGGLVYLGLSQTSGHSKAAIAVPATALVLTWCAIGYQIHGQHPLSPIEQAADQLPTSLTSLKPGSLWNNNNKLAVVPFAAIPQKSLPEDLRTIASLREQLAKKPKSQVQAPIKLEEPYVTNLGIGGGSSQLTITAKAVAPARRLRIFLDTSTPMYGQFVGRNRSELGSFDDVVTDETLSKPILTKNGNGDLMLGNAPLAQGAIRLRIAIIGPDGREQHCYYTLVRDSNGITVFPEPLQGWVSKWEQDSAAHQK